jgi:hypothetical protein
MPSFDIVSEVDLQLLDNAVNVAKKEIINRFDFRNSKTEIELNKKDKHLIIITEDEMRLNSVIDVLRMRMIKQKLDPRCLDEGKPQYASGNMIRKDIKIKQGIDKDTAKKIVKLIKDSKLKVTPQIMDDIIRVSGKKIDDLQQVIALIKREELSLPLQFVNMK